jgi:hypothetical protein
MTFSERFENELDHASLVPRVLMGTLFGRKGLANPPSPILNFLSENIKIAKVLDYKNIWVYFTFHLNIFLYLNVSFYIGFLGSQ